MRLIALLLALVLGGKAPAWAAPQLSGLAAAAAELPKRDERFEKVATLIAGHDPAGAIKVLERIIADNEKAHRGETRQVYCARSPAESLLYAGMGAEAKKEVVVFGPDWSMAIFLKGFSLIDLQRPDEARPLFERAVAMSPMNAQFLGELAEWHKSARDWGEAYALFERASAAAEFSPDEMKSHDKRRALRGMGFVLIEQGRLDEAEALFRKVLDMDPNDSGAKSELQYIDDQRAKAKSRTS
jgi:tetratricopeptide (TPR) repeat protein